MKRLVLIRHAKTEQAVEPGADFDRRLTERGHKDAAWMSDQLNQSGLIPDLILSSPVTRAVQTAEIFAKQLNYKKRDIVLAKTLYNDFYEKKEFLKILSLIEDRHQAVLVVGHNPYISDIASQFTGNNYEHIPTAGFKIILFDINTWSELSLGTGRLELFDYPAKYR